MPQLGEDFDTSTAEKRQGFEVIKAWVPAQIIESDTGPTKNGLGKRASFTFEVIDGPFKGRKVWHGINYQHASPEAQRIGQSELRELTEAIVGPGTIDNTDVLHFKPFMLKCGPDKDDPDKTAAKGFKPYDTATGASTGNPGSQGSGGFRPASGATAPQQQRTAAAGAGARPWAKAS